jgi:hypothetical protein
VPAITGDSVVVTRSYGVDMLVTVFSELLLIGRPAAIRGKIDQSLSIVAETNQISESAKFPLEFKSTNF